MTAPEIEAEVGLSVEAVKWAKERGSDGFKAWRAAREPLAANYRSLCLALKRAHDSRERFFVVETPELGEPVLLVSNDRREDPPGLLEYADRPPGIASFDLAEVKAFVQAEKEHGREAALEALRVAVAAKKLVPGSRFFGLDTLAVG